ncbi:MAG: hypothetical protein JXR60_08875 [Bacteroidales bacterium]|nr:hypothetical protein [Bacteroidales bacterium]
MAKTVNIKTTEYLNWNLIGVNSQVKDYQLAMAIGDDAQMNLSLTQKVNLDKAIFYHGQNDFQHIILLNNQVDQDKYIFTSLKTFEYILISNNIGEKCLKKLNINPSILLANNISLTVLSAKELKIFRFIIDNF